MCVGCTLFTRDTKRDSDRISTISHCGDRTALKQIEFFSLVGTLDIHGPAHLGFQAPSQLRDFDRPVLLAWAADDRFFPVEHAERLAAALPQARLELVADSYTFVSEDQPEMLVKLMRDFLPG